MDVPFLAIPREFFDDKSWIKPRKFSNKEATIDLAYMVAYQDRDWSEGGKVIKLKKGECVASLRFLGKRWKWSTKRVSTHLSGLKVTHKLTQRMIQGESVLSFDISNAYKSEQEEKETVIDTVTETEKKQSLIQKRNKLKETKKKEENISKENNIKEILESRLLRIARCVFPNAKMPRPAKELRVWSKISKSVTDEQIDLVEKFHALDKSDSYDETWHRKQDVPALMNNWQSTIELAAKYFTFESRDRKADGLDKKINSPPYFQNNQESDDAASWSLRR